MKDLSYNIEYQIIILKQLCKIILNTYISLFTKDVLKERLMFSLFIPYFGENT